MKKVGLTGGIGSGKTTVLRIFSTLSIPVYIADERSKMLLNSSVSLKEKLQNEFGEIYTNGSINKELFASMIFSDQDKRSKANEIIHPFVRKDFIDWTNEQRSPYVIQEAAILFETGAYRAFDKMILITAPESIRIDRIRARANSSLEEIKMRMDSQWTDEQKIPLCDFQIINDGTHSLIEQVLQIDKSLRS